MSAISTILARLRAAIWAIDVRDDIANAIEQCYSDVSNPTLKTEALEAALQNKIDEGEMAALTIGDHTITAEKLAQGVIDNTLATSGAAADAKKTGDEIAAVKADLDSLGGNLTDFQIFKRDKRITPWTLKINFKSMYCFTVQKFLIPTEDGRNLEILSNGYDVDWSNRTDPSFIKFLLMNDETKKLEVIDTTTLGPSFFSTYSYVGLVYAGSLYDIPVSFSAMNNDGVTQIFQYGLEHGYYAEHFSRHVGSYRIPKKVGVVGDSLSVGYMDNPPGTAHKRMLAYSWPKFIMADSGNPWLNLGQSGQTVLTWCSHNTYGKAQLEAAGNKCQMYIIGLGVNDINDSWGIPLGSPNDISSDPDRVATTYYGGYVRIIQLIKRVNQDAIIICLTNPSTSTKGETYNEAIRYIVNTYYSDDTKVMMIDMYDKYRFLFTDPKSILYKDHIKPAAGGHFTVGGYRMIATLMEYAIDDLYRSTKSTVFDTIPFIDYDTGNPTDNTMIE